MRNPWADRWEDISDGVAMVEGASMRAEAELARDMGTRTDADGLTYYYRPGVGGWWTPGGQLWKDERR